MSTTDLSFRATTGNVDMSDEAPEIARAVQRAVAKRTVGGETIVTAEVIPSPEASVATVAVDDATATPAQVLTFTATVTPGAVGAFIFTSSVDGPFAGTPSDENGEGAVAWGALSTAVHSITVTYYGDGEAVASSTSAAITVTVA